MSPKRRTIEKMFKEQFAPKVKDGTKTQTIRPKPKRPEDIPRVGDLFSGRQWEGKPYRSKLIKLREGELTDVQEVTLDYGGITFKDPAYIVHDIEEFARADGFTNWHAMLDWFKAQYGLPFTGILTKWKPYPA